jgi:hypothetical protein
VEGLRHQDHGGRLLSLLAAALVAVLIAGACPRAWAQDGPDNANSFVDSTSEGVGAWVGLPGDDSAGGSTVPSKRTCWLELDADDAGNPKWPWVDTTTGKVVLAWFWLTCDGVRIELTLLPVGGGPNVRPAARVLAQEAYRFLPLPAPQVGFNPNPSAVVNLPTWLWAERESWGQRTTNVGVTGLDVTVTAVPESVVWDLGAGDSPVTCDGPGTPYDTSRPAEDQATDCSYTFRRSSASEPSEVFEATATTVWRISWSASDGTSGTLPPLRRTTRFQIRVAEVQTVVTRPN